MTYRPTQDELATRLAALNELPPSLMSIAFVECGQVVEAILKDYHLHFLGRPPKRSVRTIEELKGALQAAEFKLPAVVRCCAELVQQLRNYRAHDQGQIDVELQRNFVEPCLVMTHALIRWYFDLIATDPSEDQASRHDQEPQDTTPPEESEQYQVALRGLTLRQRLREYVESRFLHGQVFKVGELKADFHRLNPDNSPNAIQGHICMMTTNMPSRLHHRLKKDGSDDLLFKVSKGLYRRYHPESDPTPIIDEQS